MPHSGVSSYRNLANRRLRLRARGDRMCGRLARPAPYAGAGRSSVATDVSWMLELNVEPGSEKDFRILVDEMVTATRTNESGDAELRVEPQRRWQRVPPL